jgi:UDP:flavonoid glycosyltransferase YjiC (YdhE family)
MSSNETAGGDGPAGAAAPLRVLFTTTPGWGHIYPMVPLARAFIERGDEVSWVAPREAWPWLAEAGLDVRPGGLNMDEAMAQFFRRFPEVNSLAPKDVPDFMFPRIFGHVMAEPMLRDLLPVVESWRPSLVVHEAGDFAAPIAAAAAGIPSVTHAFGAVLPKHRVALAGEAVAPLWQTQGLEPRPFGGCYDDALYLDIYPPSLQVEDTTHIEATQPLRPVAFAAGRGEEVPHEMLASEKPLVYVTFGTYFNRNVSLLAAVVEAIRALPVNVVVTIGPLNDPAQLGHQPSNVFVTRYIPQTELLPHTGVVVSHAGSGTVLAALAAGIPQLCLPQGADQFINAAAVSNAGAGLSIQPGPGAGVSIEPGSLTSEAVGDAVTRLLSDSRIAVSARRLRDAIADMPSPARVADILATRLAHSPGR